MTDVWGDDGKESFVKALQTLKLHVITYSFFDLDAKVVIFRISRESGGRMGDLTPHGV